MFRGCLGGRRGDQKSLKEHKRGNYRTLTINEAGGGGWIIKIPERQEGKGASSGKLCCDTTNILCPSPFPPVPQMSSQTFECP